MNRMLMWVGLMIVILSTGTFIMAQSPDDIYWDNTIATTGGGLDGSVSALAVYDNKLIAAGSFTVAGGVTVNHIAAWDGQSWSSLGNGLNGPVHKIDDFNNQLIVIGEFDSAGGIAARRIAAWDGDAWAPLDSGLDTTLHVWTMVEFDGKLILAGFTNWAGGDCCMAKWDGQEWAPMSVPGWAWDSPVIKLVVYQGMLVSIGHPYQYKFPIAVWTGEAWSDIGLPEGTGLGQINDVLVFNDKLIVGGDGGNSGHSVISWDGSSWSWMGKDIFWSVTALAINGSKLYAANWVAIFGDPPPPCAYEGNVYFNYDSLWGAVGLGYICGGVSAMTSYQGNLVVGGGFREVGVWGPFAKWSPYISVWIKRDPTGNVEHDGTILPDVFSVSQNYPNPFNPTTTIEYSVPKRALVTIEIFNMLGQKVRALMDETKPAGTYRTEWNGNDDAGKPVSTGVYLYRIQAGDLVQTKKMLLLK